MGLRPLLERRASRESHETPKDIKPQVCKLENTFHTHVGSHSFLRVKHEVLGFALCATSPR